MVRLFAALAALALLCSCSVVDGLSTSWEKEKTSYGASVVDYVKYRTANDGKVPFYMDKYFERDVPERGTSNIRVAGYDKDNRYLVMCFNPPGKVGSSKFGSSKDPCYHYCRFPESVWKNYKSKSNQDQFYEQTIKGNFDCRIGNGSDVPTY